MRNGGEIGRNEADLRRCRKAQRHETVSRNRDRIPYIPRTSRGEGAAHEISAKLGDRGNSRSGGRWRTEREREGETRPRVKSKGGKGEVTESTARGTGGHGSGTQCGALHLHKRNRRCIAPCGRGGVISRQSPE